LNNLDEIRAALAAATPFDFIFWAGENQSWNVRIHGHTYSIPEGGRTTEWLALNKAAPTWLAALCDEVEALREWQELALAMAANHCDGCLTLRCPTCSQWDALIAQAKVVE